MTRAPRRTAGTDDPGAGSRTSTGESVVRSASLAEGGSRASATPVEPTGTTVEPTGTTAEPKGRRGRPTGRRAGGPDAGEPASALVGQLLNWKFLLSVLGVLSLLAASLLTGVDDIFGGDGGAEVGRAHV